MAKNYVSELELDPQNDLQAIEGIGPSYAKALKEIGVNNYADLAKYYSLSDLQQDLFEKAGVDVPLWKIENTRGKEGNWLHQARNLVKVSDKNQPTTIIDEEVSHSDEWEEYVSFMVFFESKNINGGEQVWQTRTYKTENGEIQEFPGVEPSAWVNWIYEQAQLPATLKTDSKEAIDIKIIGVELQEDSLSNILERKLIADVCFEISGPKSSHLTEQQQSFLIEMWLIELDELTGHQIAVIDSRFIPNTLKYTREAIFDMPPPGRYEFRVILLLHPPNEKLVTYIGPIINIVPDFLYYEAVAT
jgi:hypothetical protein